jgi:hypothetical protein
MSDSTDTPDPTTQAAQTPTIGQDVLATAAAYGTAIKDTLSTLAAIANAAPDIETIVDDAIAELVGSTKSEITSFVNSIVSDVETLISSGG